MQQTNNIGFSFKDIALKNPDRPAIIFTDMEYSYLQLWQLVEAFAIRMREHGVGRGSVVYLNATELPVVVSSLLATSLLGARFVQNSGNLDLGDIMQISHFFHTADTDAKLDSASIQIDVKWSPVDTGSADTAGVPFEGYGDPESPWLTVFTSGTTGFPKFMNLSQRVVYDRSMAVKDEFVSGETRICSLFPSISRPFFSRAMAALLNGATIVDGHDPSFLQRVGANRITASTGQVKRYLEDTVLSPKIPVLEVSGSGLTDDDIAKLLRSFETIDHTYGASETNKTFSNFKTVSADGTIISKGGPRDSIIEIVTEDGSLCSQGQEGTVRIRNAYMASEYLNDSNAQKQAFRDGWFYPGDTGCWGVNGELEILRRKDQTINFSGTKVNPLSIDRILASVDGIIEAACFENPKEGITGELVAFAVFAENCNQIQVVATAKENCREALGDEMTPKAIRPINRIPRNSDGSPDREQCSQLVLEGIKRQAELETDQINEGSNDPLN